MFDACLNTVHISPRGIESRLNESFRAGIDARQAKSPEVASEHAQDGAVKKLVEELSEALRQERQKLAAVTTERDNSIAQSHVQAATIKALKMSQGTAQPTTSLRGTPPRPANDASMSTRTEAVLAAASAVDTAVLALQRQQQQQQQQQSLPLTDTNAGQRGPHGAQHALQEGGNGGGSAISSASERIHEAFLLLSSQDMGSGAGNASASFVLDDLPTRTSRNTQAQAAGAGALQARTPDGTGEQKLAREERAALLLRIADLEAERDVATSQAKAHGDVADDRQQRLEEAENRIAELHALFEQLEIGGAGDAAGAADARNLDKARRDSSFLTHEQIATLQEEKKELEGEILVTRRIATFRAVRIAVLQQQQQQQQQTMLEQHRQHQLQVEHRQQEHQRQTENQHNTERDLLRKLALSHDAHKSISDLKQREHDRLHASLQMAASNIARLQGENRRLQRLLQNRLIDAGDARRRPSSPDQLTPTAERRHSGAQKSHTAASSNGANGRASRAASSDTPLTLLAAPLEPQGAKPRRRSASRDSHSSPAAHKSRLSFVDDLSMSPRGRKGGASGVRHADVLLAADGRDSREKEEGRTRRSSSDTTSVTDAADGAGDEGRELHGRDEEAKAASDGSAGKCRAVVRCSVRFACMAYSMPMPSCQALLSLRLDCFSRERRLCLPALPARFAF